MTVRFKPLSKLCSRWPALLCLAALSAPAAAAEIQIDVLSLNVFGLPAPLGKNVADRARQIGTRLSGYDLIGLQETFSRQTDQLRESFAAHGGEAFACFQPQTHRLLRSGLEIFSRYPLLATDFTPFRFSSDSDALAAKGVAFARVLIRPIGPVDFYTTHYQAEDDKPDLRRTRTLRQAAAGLVPGFDFAHEALRRHDNQVLTAFVRAHDRGYPTFVVGDFNAGDDSPIVAELRQSLGLSDSFRQLHPSAEGFTSDGERNPLRRSRSRFRHDYLLYRAGSRVDSQPLLAELAFDRPGEIVSDHFGVHARFALRRRSTASVRP